MNLAPDLTHGPIEWDDALLKTMSPGFSPDALQN